MFVSRSTRPAIPSLPTHYHREIQDFGAKLIQNHQRPVGKGKHTAQETINNAFIFCLNQVGKADIVRLRREFEQLVSQNLNKLGWHVRRDIDQALQTFDQVFPGPERVAPVAGLGGPIAMAPGPVFDSRTTVDILNVLRQGNSVQVNGRLIIPGRTAADCQLVSIPDHYDISTLPRVATRSITISQTPVSGEVVNARRDGYHPTVLNFANEHDRGGNPGYQFDGNQYVLSGRPRSGAQEENLWEKSDLGIGLSEVADYPFHSCQRAYVTENTLFAVDDPANPKQSQFLPAPIPMSVVTSAAIDFHHPQPGHRGPRVYDERSKNEMRTIIRTHLKAAAFAAVRDRSQTGLPQELILGAFGCGAFAPKDHSGYARLIAETYKELLRTEFANIWDRVVFALPQFPGDQKGQINLQEFNRVFAG